MPLWNGGNKSTCFIGLFWGLKWCDSGYSLINALSDLECLGAVADGEKWLDSGCILKIGLTAFADELVGCGVWEQEESKRTLRLSAWASWKDGAANWLKWDSVGGAGLRARNRSLNFRYPSEIWGRSLKKKSLLSSGKRSRFKLWI